MTDSVKIEPRGGAFGLYRLMFWHNVKCRYIFPPFSELWTLRIGCTALRPHSLKECCRIRDSLLLRCPSICIIITPYPN